MLVIHILIEKREDVEEVLKLMNEFEVKIEGQVKIILEGENNKEIKKMCELLAKGYEVKGK